MSGGDIATALLPRSLLLYREETQAGWLKEFAQFSLALKSALQLALDPEAVTA